MLTLLQAFVRAKQQQKAYQERLQLFKANEPAIVKVSLSLHHHRVASVWICVRTFIISTSHRLDHSLAA